MTEFIKPLPACSPFCTVPGIKEDILEIKDSVKSLHNKQDLIIELNANLNNIKRDIERIEATEIREHEEMFRRTRLLESDHIGKTDVSGMVTKKDLTIYMAIIGIVFTAINIGVNVLLRVLR